MTQKTCRLDLSVVTRLVRIGPTTTKEQPDRDGGTSLNIDPTWLT